MSPVAWYYRSVILATLGVYLYYLGYRALYTINPDALTFSLIFYYAELHGFIALALYFFQLWNPIQRKSPPAPPGLSVDVYIATYNEDINLVRKTVLGCVGMRYPHKTYLLDDGNRPEFAEMARELQCSYLTREERTHAKAGNINHALALTDGEFVAVFDADYVPQPDFLEKTLGYFQDEKVAFVQTPHNYYNVDSFQFKIDVERRKKWNEQDVFYRLMMPGRDYWNSAFFAGTSAIFRKKALDDVGGFATETITEDLHTTIRIYRKGWKGIYHNELLSSGLAAKDLTNYHSQKLRWAEGNVHLLFSENPLLVGGLTIPQRICFFATIFGWFIGLPKMIFFSTPAVMLLTGWYPIVPFDWPFIQRYLIFLGAVILGFKIGSRGYGKLRYDESYNMMNFFVLIRAVLKNLFRRRSRYVVTGKGPGEPVSAATILPQVALVLLCFAGIVWGALKGYYGVSGDWIGIGVAMFWAGINGALGVSVVENVTAPRLKRAEFRFIGTVPVRYSTSGLEPAGEGLGVCRDLNEYGTALVTFAPLPMGARLSLSLYVGPTALDCTGTVLFFNPQQSREGMFTYGVKFDEISREKRDVITQFCFSTMLPGFFQRFDARQSLAVRAIFWYYNRHRTRARAMRKGITLPLTIGINPRVYAVTSDISRSGLSLLSHVRFESAQELGVEILSPYGGFETEVQVRYCKEVASGRSYLVGARFLTVDDRAAEILSMLAGGRGRKSA